MARIGSSTSHNGRHTDDVPDDGAGEAETPMDAAEAVSADAETATSDAETDVASPIAEAGPEPDVTADDDVAATAELEADATVETASDAAAEPEIAIEPDYLGELATAMRGVAGRERDRLTARAADDAASEIGQARERGATEAESIRQVADEDVASIEAWADTEIERVRADAASRIEQRRADLDAALERHESVVQVEVDSVEGALAEYDASLATFMSDLETVDDPTEIARRAGQLPKRPDLGRIRSEARTSALDRIAAAAVAAASLEAADVPMDGPGDAIGVDAAAAIPDMTEPSPDVSPVMDDGDATTTVAEDAPMVDAIAATTDAATVTPAPDAETDAPPPLVGVMDLGSMIDDMQANDPIGSSDALGSSDAIGSSDALGSSGLIGSDGWDAPATGGGSSPSALAELHTWDTGVAVVADPTGWETESAAAPTIAEAQAHAEGTAAVETPEPEPVAAAQSHGSSFGPTNAAVRLLRSVAPWTAPSHKGDDEPD